MPFNLRMAMPNNPPIRAATSPDMGRQSQMDRPYRVARIPVVYPPIRQNEDCPILTRPRLKVIQTPMAITAMIEQLTKMLITYEELWKNKGIITK